MRITSIIAFIITLIGAINWLLIGLIGFNAVHFLSFDMAVVERIVYVLVGLSGLWMVFFSFIYKPFNDAK